MWDVRERKEYKITKKVLVWEIERMEVTLRGGSVRGRKAR